MSTPVCASYLTLAGSAHGEPPRYSALERAKAAAAHGIKAIGIRLDEPLDPAILDYVTVPEAEWLDLSRQITPKEDLTLGVLAYDYGLKRINVGLCDRETIWWQAETHLMAIVSAAKRHGLTVCVEPVAFGGIRTLDNVVRLIKHAGYWDDPSVGICYDLWQVAQHYPELQHSAKITEIQACGVEFRPADMFAASQDRPLIQHSQIDVVRWVNSLRSHGCTAPLSYELPNVVLRSFGGNLDQTARIVADDMDWLKGVA